MSYRTIKTRKVRWHEFAKRKPNRDSESTAELLILVALSGAIGFGLYSFIILSIS